ncbi:xanthine dehydrogenase 1-like isoform X2 [Cucurbita pepo subsp. pepo]|uniref:xanthine dehydrogenase 1-like isoform X2 n=1 Tax=Cucurbita pepo subsp. pepo TaxID=3664 RepID=UPI000C9D55C4|nr:xanthine dehydrogenase 1-like isoform X2 [Cucurbita pepo subsp. pepo]
MGSLKSEKDIEQVGEDSKEAIVYVNGVRRVLPNGLAHLTVLEYLRDTGLTGTKLGCGEGGCGACTVMVSSYDSSLSKCMHYAVNACLAPLYSVEGMHVITVEGLGSHKRGLHPIQESLASSHGSQCGFCTPGFIMSVYALLRSSKSPPSEEQIEECLAGNLCRCTGYRPIIDAFRVFAKADDSIYTNSLNTGETDEFICPSTGKPCSCKSKTASERVDCSESIAHGNRCEPVSYNEIDGSSYSDKELIFPPELFRKKLSYLNLSGSGGLKWFRPTTLQEVLDLKARYPEAKFLVGNTEVGIEMRLKKMQYKVLVHVMHVPELNMINVKDDGIEIGAAVRLSDLLSVLRKVTAERATHETSFCKAFIEQLKWFAGTQIRNVASVGGNICTASPISDLNPLWMATRAKFVIINCKGKIRTTLAENFFLGYRKVDLANDELLLSVFLPWSRRFEYVKEFKQAHRRDDDIAIVNAGIRVFLEEEGKNWVVSDASIVYGGVAPLSLSAVKTKKYIIGKIWDQVLLKDALKVLEEDILLHENAPGGMVEFRKSLTLSFFFKFHLWVSHEMGRHNLIEENVPLSHLSAVKSFHRPHVIGSQDYEIKSHGTAVGLPEVHLSARLQVTGEAEYTDDIPLPPHGLHAALILSTKPHARLRRIDDSEARKSAGFAGIFLAKDIPADNKIGPAIPDEELFASEFVTCVGQIIGVVVADTHENVKLAARKVNVEYEELPAILSIEDAILANSFHPNTSKCLKKGDVELCFQSGQCDKIIEGEVQVGGQEHFYLEPNSSVIWTLDSGNEVHLVSSTQTPQKHQKYVSSVLGLPMSKVVCKTKRIGGGFGGKETRSAVFAAAASVPSFLLNRPVKITLDRDTDMMITGQRHSFLGKYKVPNASPTAASASSDMYGAAVLDACEQIKARMEPIAAQHNFSSFTELACACYVQRIDLSAHGFFITPEIGYDWTTGKGIPFRYFTYGAAFSEVEIDTLTGDFHTRSANIFLDLGHSLNPAIDVGQIEGAFVQGLGWAALEELKWGDPAHRWIAPGTLYTAGPGSYKIPSMNDVPFKFNVSLLKGHPNVKALHSSKAVGEPPFFLASAVLFAIKDAIIAARNEAGHDDWFPLDNPATPERIRMACLDEFTTRFAGSNFRPKLSI